MFDLEPIDDTEQEKTKGRDAVLLAQRNEQILRRYLWHSRERKLTYEWILEQLVIEFKLSESTLGQLIGNSSAELYNMKQEPMTIGQLREKYPYAKW